MRDIFYADKRDLVKWSVLLRLAALNGIQRILQIAYYRWSNFERIIIDGEEHDIPEEVIDHFRNIRNAEKINSDVKVSILCEEFINRKKYVEVAVHFVRSYSNERCIVFLDPDTGLEPQTPTLKHVLASEVWAIWKEIKEADILVFYQHQTNRRGEPWIETKRRELARAIEVSTESIKVAHAPLIARDVAFYFIKKI